MLTSRHVKMSVKKLISSFVSIIFFALIFLYFCNIKTRTKQRVDLPRDGAGTYINQEKPHQVYTPFNCTDEIYDSVKKMVLFIGSGRSGTTIIGALLDAHPHMVVANENNILTFLKTFESKKTMLSRLFNNSYRYSTEGRRKPNDVRSDRDVYHHHVPRQWQGKILDYAEIIGDKMGEIVMQRLTKRNQEHKALEFLKKELKMSVKFLHVIRNPFDVIATICLRKSKQYSERTEDDKLDFGELIKSKTNTYFRIQNETLRTKVWNGPGQTLDVYSEDFVKNPRNTLIEICQFLEIECSDLYLNDCVSITYKSPSYTRNLVKWPPGIIEEITERMKDYKFLNRYSFDQY